MSETSVAATADPIDERMRPLPFLLAAASAFLLLGALFFQFVLGLPPCPLCVDQRYAHGAALGLALIAAWPRLTPLAAGTITALAGVAYLAGTGIALFHVGVEQHWWEGLAGCLGTPLSTTTSTSDLTAQLLATPTARCDEIPWSFLGLSIAGWNALASAVLMVVAFAGAREIQDHGRT
jgi:disulfide bond formation protein DsbB